MHWGLVVCSLFSLLIASYFDNVRSPLLPILGQTLGIDYSRQALFLVLGNFAAVAGNLVILRLLQKIGEQRTAFFVGALAAVSCLLAYSVHNFLTMCVFAIVVGMAIASLGALANVFLIQGTEVRNRARFFCALHTMYGFGSFIGPMAIARAVSPSVTGWSHVFGMAVPALALLSLAFLVWVNPRAKAGDVPQTSSRLTFVQAMILIAFAVYVVGEVLSSMWLVSYVIKVYALDLETASRYSSYFFMTMGASRLLCFFSLRPERELWVIIGSLLLAIGFSLWGHLGAPWALVGVGIVGPYFPLFMARVTRSFPEQSSKITIWILGFVQLALAFAHLTLGRLSDLIGIEKAYWLPPAFLFLTLVVFLAYLKVEARSSLKRQMAV